MSVLDGLDVFVAICETGSIAAAGRSLGIPRATLSRQLSRLEDDLGVRLLHRSTRRLVRTPAGEELFGRARRVVEEATAAREAVRRQDDVPRGVLRVSMPPDMSPAFVEVLLAFVEAYPHVDLQVDLSARHVDLVGEGIDVAIRGGRVVDESLIARPLVRIQARAYASADYVARRGKPSSLEELAGHDCVLTFAQGRVPRTAWPLLEGGSVKVQGRIVTNSLTLVAEAMLEGHGIAMLPAAATHRAGVRVEPVLHDVIGVDSSVSVVWPERALLLPRVRAFIDFVAERLPPRMTAAFRDLPNLGA